MTENEIRPQRAILVAADCGEWDAEVSIDELEELAKSAGAEVIAKVIQVRRDYDRATIIGREKIDEICEIADRTWRNRPHHDHTRYFCRPCSDKGRPPSGRACAV